MEKCAICSAQAVHHVQAVTGTTEAEHGMWLCDYHARELKQEMDRHGEGWETDMVTPRQREQAAGLTDTRS